MAPVLHDLVSGTYTPSEEDDDRTLWTLLDQLRERTGIDFSAYKRPTVMRRLQRRMVATANPRLRDYVRYVQQHPEEYQRLSARGRNVGIVLGVIVVIIVFLMVTKPTL